MERKEESESDASKFMLNPEIAEAALDNIAIDETHEELGFQKADESEDEVEAMRVFED